MIVPSQLPTGKIEETLRTIVAQLCSQATEIVESETLEVKGWCSDERHLAEKASEAAACLANACGGNVVLGIEDKSSPKFSRCPYQNLTVEWLATRIQDLTTPPVECTVYDISSLSSQLCGFQCNAFAIVVPRTKCISGHITSGGVSKVRRGKECRPYYASLQDDRTAAPLQSITVSDLHLPSIRWAIKQYEKTYDAASGWESEWDFLAHVHVVERYLLDEERLPSFRIRLAALLLFGTEGAIRTHLPSFETIVISDAGSRSFRTNIVELYRDLCLNKTTGISSFCPKLSIETLQELVINAYVHRCYRSNGPVIIRVSESTFEVESPGELHESLNTSNLIYCIPVYRNFLLADAGRYIGICDKIGKGIDRVYRSILFSGFRFPIFESSNGRFVARISLDGNAEFAQFVSQRSQTLSHLDDIIVLRYLWDHQEASGEALCSAMERGIEFGGRHLEEMLRKLMIEPVDGASARWRLSPVLKQDIAHIFQSNQLKLKLT